MRYRCSDCKGSLDKLRSAPMLHDDIWHAVARDVARLCDTCLRNRMRRVLSRSLRFEDITVCRFNMWTGHHHELTSPGDQRFAYEAEVDAQQRAYQQWMQRLYDEESERLGVPPEYRYPPK